MGILTNEQFLERLDAAYKAHAASGTVFVSLKRYTDDDRLAARKEKGMQKKKNKDADAMDVDAEPAAASPSAGSFTKEYPCLMRAKAGKAKFSTLIHPDDTDRFLEQYAAVMKRNADVLLPPAPPKSA
ncbi:RNA-binding signal recognition particle subunit srp14 [Blastocladiella emersonii ATCC 22665]|nr:RNA-binding signal recognition particle subunit srp14 [Blastocladiella emersonii ATCC 22665]